MRTGYASVLVCLLSSALLVMTGCGGDSPSGSPVATEATPLTIPPGYSSKSIHVKFQEGSSPQPVIRSNALLTRQTSMMAYPGLIGSLLNNERMVMGSAQKGSLPYNDESGRSGCSGQKERRPLLWRIGNTCTSRAVRDLRQLLT